MKRNRKRNEGDCDCIGDGGDVVCAVEIDDDVGSDDVVDDIVVVDVVQSCFDLFVVVAAAAAATGRRFGATATACP